MMLFVRIHKLEDGYKILLSLEQNHFSSNKYIYTTLLNGCFNENNIQLAKKIVDVYSRFYHWGNDSSWRSKTSANGIWLWSNLMVLYYWSKICITITCPLLLLRDNMYVLLRVDECGLVHQSSRYRLFAVTLLPSAGGQVQLYEAIGIYQREKHSS